MTDKVANKVANLLLPWDGEENGEGKCEMACGVRETVVTV